MIKNKTKNKSVIADSQFSKVHHQNIMSSKMKQLNRQYESIQSQIKSLMNLQTKPNQIRVRQWLLKLQAVAEIQQWTRNRNLYLKVLLIMLKRQSLTYPFHKLPPNSSLPKLSLYEVAFDVRKQFEQEYPNTHISINEDQKQNINELNSKCSFDNSISYNRSRQKHNIQSKIAQQQIRQFVNPQQPNPLDKQISQTIRFSYNFILKNINTFSDKEEADALLEQLWNFSIFR